MPQSGRMIPGGVRSLNLSVAVGVVVFEALRQAGIGVNLHYIPVHTQPYYRNLGFETGDFPQAERYFAEAFSLPLFYDLTDEEQQCVVDLLREALS